MYSSSVQPVALFASFSSLLSSSFSSGFVSEGQNKQSERSIDGKHALGKARTKSDLGYFAIVGIAKNPMTVGYE
jgi:hypothetical protein